MSFFGGPERVQVMTGDQKNLLNQASGMVSRGLQYGVPQYGGQITPGATANQQMAFGQAGNLLRSSMLGGAAQQATMGALSGQPAFTVDPAQRERYYQQSVVNPARAGLKDTLRGIDARYGDRWSNDSGAHRAAVNDAAVRFNTELGGIRGQLVNQDVNAGYGAMENAANRALGAVGTTMGLDANTRANLGAVAGLGGDQRAIQGQFQGEDYNKWLAAQDWANPYWGQFSSVMSASPYAVGQKQGIGGALLGGIGGLMSGVGGLL